MNEPLSVAVKERFPEAVLSAKDYRGELTLVLRKEDLLSVCTYLRDEMGFDSLRDICGADYYRPEDRFEVVYNIYSLEKRTRLRLKVRVDESDLAVPSVTGVWTAAGWPERETYDMFGIKFTGHPDLRRMYMPEEFEHHPLRKDFPLMGIPGSLPLPRK